MRIWKEPTTFRAFIPARCARATGRDLFLDQNGYVGYFQTRENMEIRTRKTGSHFAPRLTDIFLENLDTFLAIRDCFPDVEEA